MVVIGVYIIMVQVAYRNSYEKVPKNEWVQVDPPLCTNGSEKWIRHLSVKENKDFRSQYENCIVA